MRVFRRKVRGWILNSDAWYRKIRKEILMKLDAIDKNAEIMGLSAQDREEQKDLRSQLHGLLKQVEMKWLQRYKDKEIKDGDCNTKYYHAKVNGRRRKNRILSLEQEEGVIEGKDNLIRYITDFYKKLFGQPDTFSINLNILGGQAITREHADTLVKPFSMEELQAVVFGMEKNKSPGPDGIPVDFYQHFWETVKWDLMKLLNDFHEGKLDITRLNYGIITLVPKSKDAKQIQKFRPICLLNVSFKIITKVLMNRLSRIIKPIILPTQTAFIKGRYIMEGIVILHEALNSIHHSKQSVVLFKVDFEKAYDKIKWPFVYKMLKMKQFPDKWCDLVMHTMIGGQVGIKVNDKIGPYFKTYKGLRQGDSMSPLLFDIAADALAIILDKAKHAGYVRGGGY
uniref:Reverse transcriptase domain-containing protein n=1 Tax=Aegilops tauschii subsp. strangulata TaxID=200361 RepID=A0A453KWR1_AEGTS